MNINNIKNSIFLMTSLVLAACEKPEVPPTPPRPALVMVVGKTAINKSMVLVGEVKSRYESNQSFRIGGKIIERKVEVGSQVKRGQVLARIDATDTNLNTQAANADVRAAEANYELAKAEVERQRKLVEKKFISQSALEVREADLKTSAAKVQQAKAQASATGNQSRYATLVADREGVVTQVHAEPGQVVQAGEMVAQIVDTKQIEVLISVPESRMTKVKIGEKVAIKLWADREKTYLGIVREVAPAASSTTRTFDVRVAIKDADEAVKLGMTAGVKFADEGTTDILVPSAALTQINGKSIVWVIDKNGVANTREVTAGQYSEEGVPIISGLQADELVAIAGVHTLVKGQKVQPKLAEQFAADQDE
ncbi:MAG: efflux RND transporter periplasmic adaptor subunit [Methylophilaceae bacterium]